MWATSKISFRLPLANSESRVARFVIPTSALLLAPADWSRLLYLQVHPCPCATRIVIACHVLQLTAGQHPTPPAAFRKGRQVKSGGGRVHSGSRCVAVAAAIAVAAGAFFVKPSKVLPGRGCALAPKKASSAGRLHAGSLPTRDGRRNEADVAPQLQHILRSQREEDGAWRFSGRTLRQLAGMQPFILPMAGSAVQCCMCCTTGHLQTRADHHAHCRTLPGTLLCGTLCAAHAPSLQVTQLVAAHTRPSSWVAASRKSGGSRPAPRPAPGTPAGPRSPTCDCSSIQEAPQPDALCVSCVAASQL